MINKINFLHNANRRGGERGIVEEGKGATFTDAKIFAVPSHPP